MSRVFARLLAGRLSLAVLGVLGVSSAVSAQTTVTLQQSRTQAWYATVRGGTYADTNLSTILETRASSDPEYLRRSLLKFDTQNTVPSGATISNALLTVTVKQGSADALRRIGIYQVTTSWEDIEVTYRVRKTATAWGTAGGDIGSRITEAPVPNIGGTRVSFNVTPLVQQSVSGALGSSRYTRLAMIDLDAAGSESWRSYYTSSESNSALRPTLTVTYGSAAAPAPPPPTTGSVLRVLQYNVGKNGWGTDGRYDPNRIVNVVAKVNPDIISLNEVERWNSYSQGLDGVELYKSLLEQKTGVRWYVWHAQSYGVWDDKGLINVVFSKIPFSATYRTIYSAGKLKSVGGVTITFNGRPINFMTTHFDPYSDAYRVTQARELVTYMRGFAENRIVAGDFNDQNYDAPITTMTASYFDAWAEAKKAGIASAPADNPDGSTRNSRIDYIFYSRGEQHLTLRKVQVVETRDANGVMPSDHRPVVAEFLVQ
jgi:endonuclease/exonuclease/phosphatase family metal-dependent hydrolase